MPLNWSSLRILRLWRQIEMRMIQKFDLKSSIINKQDTKVIRMVGGKWRDHRSQGRGGDHFNTERDSKQERIWGRWEQRKSIGQALEAISKAIRIFVNAEGRKRIYISWALFQTPGFQSLDQQADRRCLDWESWLFPADTVPAGILAKGNRDQHNTTRVELWVILD